MLDVDGERVAFVAVDLGIYSSEHLVTVCKERFGISHLVLSSSHTHSARARNYAAFFEERLIQVVEAAVKDMFRARISAGHRSFPSSGSTALSCARTAHTRESWFGDGHYTPRTPSGFPFGPADLEVGASRSRTRKAGLCLVIELRLPRRRRLPELCHLGLTSPERPRGRSKRLLAAV